MKAALQMATAANNALIRNPRDPAVQEALDFPFNNGDQTLVDEFGPRKQPFRCLSICK